MFVFIVLLIMSFYFLRFFIFDHEFLDYYYFFTARISLTLSCLTCLTVASLNHVEILFIYLFLGHFKSRSSVSLSLACTHRTPLFHVSVTAVCERAYGVIKL